MKVTSAILFILSICTFAPAVLAQECQLSPRGTLRFQFSQIDAGPASGIPIYMRATLNNEAQLGRSTLASTPAVPGSAAPSLSIDVPSADLHHLLAQTEEPEKAELTLELRDGKSEALLIKDTIRISDLARQIKGGPCWNRISRHIKISKSGLLVSREIVALPNEN